MDDIQTNALFATKLLVFVDKISEDALSDKQTFCLQRIVNDYQAGLLGGHNLVDNIVVNQLLASTTLSQLNPKLEISQGITINPQNFAAHLDELTQRIASLPLNNENREHINLIILPGIATVIHDEQAIIEHVTTHYGRLYYLNDSLPLHTDHAPATNPEEYRLILHRLLINVFAAADIAYKKGLLNLFCEKICLGYCFEGRVRDVFEWVTCLSDVVSFDAVMEKYLYKEYVPYAEMMNENTGEDAADVMLADPIVRFIMARHRNDVCLPDSIYAPGAKVTVAGIKKYLNNMFGLISQRDREQNQLAIRETDSLITALETKSTLFWNYPWGAIIQTKIDALTALKVSLETTSESPDVAAAARTIKRQYPLALGGFFGSKTKTFLDQLEADNDDNLVLI